MLPSFRSLKPLAVVLLAASLLTSCSGVEAPTAPGTMAVRDSTSELSLPIITPLLNGLIACPRQPYAYTEQVVGPNGGTIQVGNHKLVIPRNALSASVRITAEAPADFVASVRFQPEGLQFARDAKLTLDYSTCPLARLRLFKHIAFTTDRLFILDLLNSQDNILAAKISTDLEHFSRYAVAW